MNTARTPEGRTPARLLQFNTEERVRERLRLVALERYPMPDDAN